MPIREATATVRTAYPALRLVVERFSATHDRRNAHVLLCDACGATLAPPEGATQVRCNYCEAVNLIGETTPVVTDWLIREFSDGADAHARVEFLPLSGQVQASNAGLIRA
jgi:LSD1 subclass zinc finger protein